MTAMAGLGEELYERSNGTGMGAWLADLFQRLGLPFPAASLAPQSRHVTGRSTGFVLTIGCVAAQESDWRDALVLERAEGDATAPMPHGLDSATETLDSAKHKLTDTIAGGSAAEIAAGDRRVSFFHRKKPPPLVEEQMGSTPYKRNLRA
ncbi:hypothetical protein [Consotaella aegiceratis]|uniref:hypothetical protein n=1 Tax=Consotaella aegiceratis TaxID=3097961 RepID=UPI002F41ADE9